MPIEPLHSSVRWIQRVMVFVAALNLTLIGYGLLRFPQTLTASADGMKGLLADVFILTLYAVIGVFGAQQTFRASPDALRVGAGFGVGVTLIYAAVVESEYLVRFDANGGRILGVTMVVALFSLFFLAGVRGAYVSGRTRVGVLAAMWSAFLGTLIWFSLVMLTYYIFLGTPQQDHVLYVENHDDFVHSGMTDFRAFIMQDFMGACFFHLLISPLFAAVLGSVGSVIGIGGRFIQSRLTKTV